LRLRRYLKANVRLSGKMLAWKRLEENRERRYDKTPIESLRQGRKEELWQMWCGFIDLSLEQVYGYPADAASGANWTAEEL
jgi:adenylate cyclase